MNKIYRIIGNSTLLSLCTIAGLFTEPVLGQNAYVQRQQCTQCRSVPRANGAVVCTPNTQNWGFYSPTWRVWPNERRPDVTFPQVIGAERVPTPAGVRPENISGNSIPQHSFTENNGAVDTNNALPSVNFDNGSQPFVPTQDTELPLEPVVEAPATEVPVATPATEAPVATPATEAPATVAPVAEVPAATTTAPEADAPVLESVPETPAPTSETPAEPASSVPDTPDFKGLEPIVDPSMTTIENSTNSTVDTPVAPLPDSNVSDTLAVPPLSQLPTLPDNTTTKEDAKKSFRTRQHPEQVQAPVEPAIGNDSNTEISTPSNVTPIETTYNANNPLRPSSATVTTIPTMTNDMEPVALEGYSLVDLINLEKWTPGKKEFAVVFEGRTYYCSDATQKDEFMANPEKYAPACRGFDPMLKLNEGKDVDGKVDFCVVYGKKLYVFSSAQTMSQFRQNAKQYSHQIAELEK